MFIRSRKQKSDKEEPRQCEGGARAVIGQNQNSTRAEPGQY
mgnify:CR=1 FL=1